MFLELLYHGYPHKDIRNRRIGSGHSCHLLCNEGQICQVGGGLKLFWSVAGIQVVSFLFERHVIKLNTVMYTYIWKSSTYRSITVNSVLTRLITVWPTPPSGPLDFSSILVDAPTIPASGTLHGIIGTIFLTLWYPSANYMLVSGWLSFPLTRWQRNS